MQASDCWQHCYRLIVNGTCYAELGSTSPGFEAATARCESTGGALAVLPRESDWDAFQDTAAISHEWNGYIGLRQDSDSPEPAANWAWHYPGGYKVALNYVPWNRNEPNDIDAPARNTAQFGRVHSGAVADSRGDRNERPICMYNFTVPSDAVLDPETAPLVDRTGGNCDGSDGSRTINGQCYALLPLIAEHSAVKANCESQGGVLATFKTAADLFALPVEWHGWIGLQQRTGAAEPDQGFEWHMPDGSIVENSLDIWGWGEPNGQSAGESYVEIKDYHFVNDMASHYPKRGICQWAISLGPGGAISDAYTQASIAENSTMSVASSETFAETSTQSILSPKTFRDVGEMALLASMNLRNVIALNETLATLDDSIQEMIQIMKYAHESALMADVNFAAEKFCSMAGLYAQVIYSELNNPSITPELKKAVFNGFDSSIPSDPADITYFEEEPLDVWLQKAAVSEIQKTAAKGAGSIKAAELELVRALAARMSYGDRKSFQCIEADFTVAKGTASSVLADPVTGDDYGVEFPTAGMCAALNYCEEIGVVLKVAYKRGNSYEYADSINKVNTGSLDVQLFREDDLTELNITNTTQPIKLSFRKHKVDYVNVSNVNQEIKDPVVHRYSPLALHALNITKPGSSVTIEINASEPNCILEYYINFNEAPLPTPGFHLISGSTKDGRLNLLLMDEIPAEFIGMLFLGIGELAKNQSNVTSREFSNGNYYEKRLSTSYNLRMYTSGCYFFDEDSGEWSDRGCKVGPETSALTTQCLCNHLTSFAAGLFVAPNKIDFDYVFKNFSVANNPAIFIAVGVIFLSYFFLLVFMRRLDREDIVKLGITPLPDNNPKHLYLYQIAVRTGLWPGSATDSRVQFVLAGETGETGVREMGDSTRQAFRRSQTNQFLMATERPIGDLDFLRIWHDNSGKGSFASWYLSDLSVLDLQNGQKWTFIANKWLALDKADGLIERVVPVSNSAEQTAFGHLFAGRSKRELADEHIWLSVFTRPPSSKFTRVERLSCCLCVLVTSMLTSAMWYGRVPDGESPNSFDVGPITLSPETLSVAILSNLIVFPINFIIILLFRKARRRVKQARRVKETVESKYHADRNIAKRSKIIDLDGDTGLKRKIPWSLPWWTRYIAWAICTLVIAACTLFILFYGIQFGDTVARKWLSSIVVGFFTSVVFTQTIKIVLLAVFCACLCKNRSLVEDEEDIDSLYVLGHDEEYLHKIASTEPRDDAHDKETAEQMRILQIKETKAKQALRELVVFAAFAVVVVVMSYGSVSNAAYRYNAQLRRSLLGQDKGSFENITSVPTFYAWLSGTFVPAIRAPKWYNGAPALHHTGYFADRVTRIMGYATLRQVRVDNYTCSTAIDTRSFTHPCLGASTLINKESKDFYASWKPLKSPAGYQNSKPPTPYRHRSSAETQALPFVGEVGVYAGGGYVAELRGTIKEMEATIWDLYKEAWIDRHTRLIKVDVSAYNAFSHHFVHGYIALEFPPSGGIIKTARFDPIRLLRYERGMGLALLASEILFYGYVIFVAIKELKTMRSAGWKYLGSFWSWVELLLMILALMIAGVYVKMRLIEKDVMDKFEETRGLYYTNLEMIVWWQEFYGAMLALVLFLTTLKLIRMLRFNRRIMMMLVTFKHARSRLFGMGMVFILIFTAYTNLFHRLLYAENRSYATYLRSLEKSFAIMLGKKAFEGFSEGSILAGVFFFLFALSIIIMMLNLLASILSDMFDDVKDSANKQDSDYEVLDHIIARSKHIFGGGSGSALHVYKAKRAAKCRVFVRKADAMTAAIHRLI